jgi:penicillin-binding protein-related factor A (putative recombinase)
MDIPSLTGKEFEKLVLWRARTYDEPNGLYCMGRYGVMSIFKDNEWMPVPSLPDFEGILMGGRQFIFDAKTCSQSSYALSGGTSKSFEHQYKHLRRREAFGAICFLLMHFNARDLKTKQEPAFTSLLSVGDTPLWRAYDAGEQKTITRKEAEMYGIPVTWDTPGHKKIPSPDLYTAIMATQQKGTS